MSLQLDPRQRAMLAEMGVRVWQPQPAAAETPAVQPPSVSARMPVRAEPGSITPASTTPVTAAAPDLTRPSAPVTVGNPPAAPMAPPVRSNVSLTPLPAGLAQMDWPQLQAAASNCRACALCENRTHSVFAQGEPQPHHQPTDWLIVGDAPTDAEDANGQAFGGNDGVLLDAMLQAMGLSRPGNAAAKPSVVLVHAMKCRGPTQRPTSAEEIAVCQQYLSRQISLLRPRVILALGRLAALAVLHEQLSQQDDASLALGKLRGQVHQVQGCPVVVSYHPAFLLRTPTDKARAWSDLCLAMAQLNRPALGA
jgi:uracil-DNA glycosylase family 4